MLVSRFGCVVAAMFIASMAGAASAGTVTLEDLSRGWVTNDGARQKGNGNIFTGYSTDYHYYRSYIQFDISGLTGIVTGGSFSVLASKDCNKFTSGCLFTKNGSETVAFHDVNEEGLGPILASGTASGSTEGKSIFEDLGTGDTYGEFTITGPNYSLMPEVSFGFNDAMIRDLNKAIQDGDQTFALGTRMTTASGIPGKAEVFWSHSVESLNVKIASLNVEYTEQVAAVPLPASLPLLVGAFAALGYAARRSKKS